MKKNLLKRFKRDESSDVKVGNFNNNYIDGDAVSIQPPSLPTQPPTQPPVHLPPIHLPPVHLPPVHLPPSPRAGCSNWVSPTTHPPPPIDDYIFSLIESAYKCRLATYRLKSTRGREDEVTFIDNVKPIIFNKIKQQLNKRKVIKINLRMEAIFTKLNDIQTFNFKSKNFIITFGSDIMSEINIAMDSILLEFDDFICEGSGWTFSTVSHMDLCINSCGLLKASSYLSLPLDLINRRCIINPKNMHDNMCLKWALLAYLYPPSSHAERITNYEKYIDKVKFTNISFPVSISDVPKVEILNNISINVFGYNNRSKKIYPLYFNNKKRFPDGVDLLFLKSDNKSHYCLIKNISRLLSTQISLHNGAIHLCRNCLNSFTSNAILKKHESICLLHESAIPILPPVNKSILKFSEYNKMFKLKISIYADFECILVPLDTANGTTIHKISSYTYFINNTYIHPKKRIIRKYRGEGADVHFVKTIYKDSQNIINKYFRKYKPLVMSPSDEIEFQKATHCKLCNQTFLYDEYEEEVIVKCRDHDHVSGCYRGPLCGKCNLANRSVSFIPVFFHNFSKYDQHLLMGALSPKICPGDVTIIPTSTERYISVTKYVHVDGCKKLRKYSLRFLDSFLFLPSSLDVLAKNLTPAHFLNMKVFFPDVRTHHLLFKKSIFPHEYMTSFAKYDEKALPPKAAFYSKLTASHITNEQYRHAQAVWNAFNIQTLGCYSDTYNLIDTYLLYCVVESFRNLCVSCFNLDPAFYFSLPGYSWSAMLKQTRAHLDLLTDYDMILFVERGIRGGVAQQSHRYAEANNPLIPGYQTTNDLSYLFLLDYNQLYGTNMVKCLPHHSFQWLTPAQIDVLDIPSLDINAMHGYILDVDLSYPTSLHFSHNEFPVAPFCENVDQSWLSPYLGNDFQTASNPKLLTTLFNKKNYIIHAATLQLYLSLGLELTNINRGIKFVQSRWLKPYVDMIIKLKKESTDDFSKYFFKLLINSVYGKSLENMRKHVNIKISYTWKQARKYISKPTFKRSIIFNENMVAHHFYKGQIHFIRPYYTGFAILDLAKYDVYNFHYNVMKKKYNEDLKLMYVDTDSFVYYLKRHDIYADLQSDSSFLSHFDFSNYPANHRLFSDSNKLELGKIKDELAGAVMTHFIALRSKMYAYLTHQKAETKKVKGVKKYIINNELSFDDFLRCLSNKRSLSKDQCLIMSKKHQLYTIEMKKKTLCAYDDKRFIMLGGVASMSYGNVFIQDYINLIQLEQMLNNEITPELDEILLKLSKNLFL